MRKLSNGNKHEARSLQCIISARVLVVDMLKKLLSKGSRNEY